MSSNDEITLIVVEPESEADEDGAGLPTEEFELQSAKDLWHKLRGQPKQVKLSALRDRMAEVQGDVDQLLAKMKPSTGDYRLSEVQVSLAISGSGSIGVATVGAEASITLTFAPSGKEEPVQP